MSPKRKDEDKLALAILKFQNEFKKLQLISIQRSPQKRRRHLNSNIDDEAVVLLRKRTLSDENYAQHSVQLADQFTSGWEFDKSIIEFHLTIDFLVPATVQSDNYSKEESANLCALV